MAGRSTVEILTEQIRQASDILDVVSSYVSLKRAGRGFKGLCPFHNEKTPSFNVTPDKQTFKCFGCGAGGDVFKFIQLREGVGFVDARAILARRAGIDIDQAERRVRPGSGETEVGKIELEETNRWAADWFSRQLAGSIGGSARHYLETRGFEAPFIDRFGLGFAPDRWDALLPAARQAGISEARLSACGLIKPRESGGHYDGFRNRVMFPIRDELDRVIGFGGRTLGDDNAKYINSPQSALFDKSRCLYGLSAAKESFREQRVAIVVEGYVDCIMCHQFGFSGAVATLGTALTEAHVRLLGRFVDRVVLLFDSDEAGQRAAESSLPLFLSDRLEVELAHVPEGKDPADFLVLRGKEAFQEVLTSGRSALEFKWNQVVRQCRGQASQLDRRRAVEEYLGLLVRSADLDAFEPIQRGLILNQVGKLLGLPTEEVYRQLRIIARKSGVARARVAPAGGRGIRRADKDEASCALRELIEVCLNEPRYLEQADVAEVFDPDLIADADLRAVADALREMAKETEGFSLAALIGRFDSVETAALITDLEAAGQRRGNFDATVAGAVRRLEQFGNHRRLSAVLEVGLRGLAPAASDRVLLADPTAGASSEGKDENSAPVLDEKSALLAVAETAKKFRHFAPHKHLAAPSTWGAGPGAPRNAP